MIGLDTVADFTWGFCDLFLLEVGTPNGIKFFVWSDPDYEGDNTIRPYDGNPANFVHEGFMGRDKGTHTIGGYCGDGVKFINCGDN